MSLTIESYTIVSRNYLNGLMNKLSQYLACCTGCSYCSQLILIKKKLDKNSFDTFNKDIDCWKINVTSLSLTVVPIVD